MFEQGFVIAYAAMAFGGAGFALWAGYEWYMISKRCRVLELALEREKRRRRERDDASSVTACGRDTFPRGEGFGAGRREAAR